jgi:hypothetical protein
VDTAIPKGQRKEPPVRKTYDKAFKAKIVLEAIRDEKPFRISRTLIAFIRI